LTESSGPNASIYTAAGVPLEGGTEDARRSLATVQCRCRMERWPDICRHQTLPGISVAKLWQ